MTYKTSFVLLHNVNALLLTLIYRPKKRMKLCEGKERCGVGSCLQNKERKVDLKNTPSGLALISQKPKGSIRKQSSGGVLKMCSIFT